MKLHTEADTEAVVLPGRAMIEPAVSEALGKHSNVFAELAKSHSHMGWLLQLALMELLAWGTLPPSGAAQQLPWGLFSNENFWYSTLLISSLTLQFHLTIVN